MAYNDKQISDYLNRVAPYESQYATSSIPSWTKLGSDIGFGDIDASNIDTLGSYGNSYRAGASMDQLRAMLAKSQQPRTQQEIDAANSSNQASMMAQYAQSGNPALLFGAPNAGTQPVDDQNLGYNPLGARGYAIPEGTNPFAYSIGHGSGVAISPDMQQMVNHGRSLETNQAILKIAALVAGGAAAGGAFGSAASAPTSGGFGGIASSGGVGTGGGFGGAIGGTGGAAAAGGGAAGVTAPISAFGSAGAPSTLSGLGGGGATALNSGIANAVNSGTAGLSSVGGSSAGASAGGGLDIWGNLKSRLFNMGGGGGTSRPQPYGAHDDQTALIDEQQRTAQMLAEALRNRQQTNSVVPGGPISVSPFGNQRFG